MKKKRKWIRGAVLIVTLLVFAGYLAFRRIKTDFVGPEITIDSAPLVLSVSEPQEAYLQGVTAHDDQDGDVTALVMVESIYAVTDNHQVTVTYAACDSAGNVTKAKRQVTLTDYKSPRFTLDCALVFPASAGIDVMNYVGAEDVIDGDILRRVRASLISNSGSLMDEGIHDVLLRVTNSIGDVSELILPVEIHAPEKYNAQLVLETYLLYLPVGASFNGRNYLTSFTYAGRTIEAQNMPAEARVTVSEHVDTGTPGVYPVTYSVTYTFNEITYQAYSKLFVIVEG